jgi:hypothetical protein
MYQIVPYKLVKEVNIMLANDVILPFYAKCRVIKKLLHVGPAQLPHHVPRKSKISMIQAYDCLGTLHSLTS